MPISPTMTALEISPEHLYSPKDKWLTNRASGIGFNTIMVRTLLLLACSLVAPNTFAMHVVFFNPGYEQPNNPTGTFWPDSNSVMQAVANDFDIQLESFYANRDIRLMRQQVEEVISREDKPDYLLLVNERFALNALFPAIEGLRYSLLLSLQPLQ